jgi:hypothetical protein
MVELNYPELIKDMLELSLIVPRLDWGCFGLANPGVLGVNTPPLS